MQRKTPKITKKPSGFRWNLYSECPQLEERLTKVYFPWVAAIQVVAALVSIYRNVKYSNDTIEDHLSSIDTSLREIATNIKEINSQLNSIWV